MKKRIMYENGRKNIKIKYLKCCEVKCTKCPLCTKLCQTFVNGRDGTIGAIIERMYEAKRLSNSEYNYAKIKAEEIYGG